MKYGTFGGAVFENAAVSEILKRKLGQGIRPEMYFWRAQNGTEIDLIVLENGKTLAYEIKLSSMIKPDMLKNLTYWLDLSESADVEGFIVTNSKEKPPLPKKIKAVYWRDL